MPFLAGYTGNASTHAISALPSIVQPETVTRPPGKLASTWHTRATSACCTTPALGDETAYKLAPTRSRRPLPGAQGRQVDTSVLRRERLHKSGAAQLMFHGTRLKTPRPSEPRLTHDL